MDSTSSLTRLVISPSGAIHLEGDPTHSKRIAEPFARGVGHGMLLLGARDVAQSELVDPSLAYFRELGHRFVTALCALPAAATDREHEQDRLEVPLPDASDLEALVRAAPPMKGVEYLDSSAVARLWSEMNRALAAELASFRGSLEAWLQAQSPAWNVVGRVVFHLAENRRDEHRPFAFLATYARGLSARGRVQHAPLGSALEEYAGARNRQALLALLAPVQRAAEKSALVRDLVDSGDVFHALAWSPPEALTFLKSVPELETSGVVVRVPDWWRPHRPPRPRVSVTVGTKAPSALGLDALLNFEIGLSLDGEPLGPKDLAELARSTSGLVRLKGRWVELDRERLDQALAHWKAAQRAAQSGMSFSQAMRLLAGAPAPELADADQAAAAREWSGVVSGEWLSARLAALTDPAHAEGRDRPPDPKLLAELRPYQLAGLRWLRTLHALGLGGCLADDMGLGKTVQVLALVVELARTRKRRPSLVVAPASVLANWRAEAEKFTPSLRVLVAHPSVVPSSELANVDEARLADVDLVVTSHGALRRLEWLARIDWQLAVVDEAQAIKNPTARQTRAAKRLKAVSRLALTGTPIENRLTDLWSIFDFTCPGLLGGEKQFAAFTKSLSERDDGYAPLRKLIAPYLLRRLKTDKSIVHDLPDKTEVVAYCPLTKKQAALYQRAVVNLARELELAKGIRRRGIVLASLLALKQICNHPSQWLGDDAWADEDSGKLGRLRELVEPIAERQEKVLVFTQFRELTQPLARHLAATFGRPGLVLDGTTPVARRRELVERFQDELGPPFFVISLKAGGSGLNLTAASHVVHFDRWWNPAVENQATDRAFRIGQSKNVLVHKLVCRGTVEERIERMLAQKSKLAGDVLETGAETVLTELPTEELLRIVSLDLQSALKED